MTKNLNAMFQIIRSQSTASLELWALTKRLSFVEDQVTIELDSFTQKLLVEILNKDYKETIMDWPIQNLSTI
jgi:hypothetical protein